MLERVGERPTRQYEANEASASDKAGGVGVFRVAAPGSGEDEDEEEKEEKEEEKIGRLVRPDNPPDIRVSFILIRRS